MFFLLYGWGRFAHGMDLQPSMSAYFWAAADPVQCASFPMRTVFVGFLFAIGAGLYAYKGVTPLENNLLNVAGACAWVVAIFPERITDKEAQTSERIAQLFQRCPKVGEAAAGGAIPWHYLAAVGLFIMLAVVALRCARNSLEYAPDTVDVDRFRRAYAVLGGAMVLFPLPGLAVAAVLGLLESHKVFFIEAAGVITFGIYWVVKSREMWLSKVESAPQQAADRARDRRQRRERSAAPPSARP